MRWRCWEARFKTHVPEIMDRLAIFVLSAHTGGHRKKIKIEKNPLCRLWNTSEEVEVQDELQLGRL